MLRDWSTGKFPRYTTPPSKTSTSASPLADSALEKYYSADDSILTNLRPRREMRKNGGLIKFASGQLESRKVVTEDQWNSLKEDNEEASEDDSDNGMEVDNDKADVLVEDEEDEEDEELEEQEDDEEAEDVPPPISNKQKRKRTNEAPAAPPSKKVSFGSDSKIPRQARVAGPLKGKATGKSALKVKPVASVTAKPKPVTGKREQKVANTATKKTPAAATSSVGSGEAYDFGKFF